MKKVKLWECQDCGKLTTIDNNKKKPSCWCCIDDNGNYFGKSKSGKNIQKKIIAKYNTKRKNKKS